MLADLPTTTKYSHWQKVADVKGGQYFKHYGRWYLALAEVRPVTRDDSTVGRLYAWQVQALNSDGADQWVGVYRSHSGDPELIEVSNEGKRPKPFTPSTLRRKARAHQETATREAYAAHLKVTLARRLEEGSIAG